MKCIQFFLVKRNAKSPTNNTSYFLQYLQKVSKIQYTTLLTDINCISAQKKKILQRGYSGEIMDKLLHMHTFIFIFFFI